MRWLRGRLEHIVGPLPRFLFGDATVRRTRRSAANHGRRAQGYCEWLRARRRARAERLRARNPRLPRNGRAKAEPARAWNAEESCGKVTLHAGLRSRNLGSGGATERAMHGSESQ